MCIVRNPFDRLVSAFLYMRMPRNLYHDNTKENPTKHPCHDLARRCTFAQFVHLLVRGKVPPSPHLQPQTDFLWSPAGAIHTRMLRLECLDADMAQFFVCRDIGTRLDRVNSSRDAGDDWRKYYTPELMDLVRKIYAVDFVHLPYTSTGEPSAAHHVFPHHMQSTASGLVTLPPASRIRKTFSL